MSEREQQPNVLEEDFSENRNERRHFIKLTATTAVGIAVGSGLVQTVLAQQMRPMRAVKLGDRAFLPDGRQYTREDILSRLGLDPTTPPDAWLCVCGCGSNAAALKARDAIKLLDQGKIKNEMLSPRQMDQIRRIRGR